MKLLYASILNKKRNGKYKNPCIVCSKTSPKRVLLVLEANGKRIKKSICFSINKPEREDFKSYRGKSYDDVYPTCLYNMLGIPLYNIPYFAGKALKVRDAECKCSKCGKSAVGGLWVSTHGLNKYAFRTYICIECLGV